MDPAHRPVPTDKTVVYLIHGLACDGLLYGEVDEVDFRAERRLLFCIAFSAMVACLSRQSLTHAST